MSPWGRSVPTRTSEDRCTIRLGGKAKFSCFYIPWERTMVSMAVGKRGSWVFGSSPANKIAVVCLKSDLQRFTQNEFHTTGSSKPIAGFLKATEKSLDTD